jgi:hypothetical protein
VLIQCPHCQGRITVNGLGRKRLNIPVINIRDALQLHRSVTEAAGALGCSRSYIYKVLKMNGLKVEDFARKVAIE